MNDALLRGAVQRAGPESVPSVWLSTYGLAPETVDAFQERAAALLQRLFVSARVLHSVGHGGGADLRPGPLDRRAARNPALA